MSEEESSYNKSKTISKGYKRKRTTIKQAKQQGKSLLACQHCPQNKKKTYLSYPALYSHVRFKHPGITITSAKGKDKTKKEAQPTAQVLKLKSILKASDPKKEEIERELIDIKLYICYKLSENFLHKKKVEYSQIGEKGTDKFMQEVNDRSFELSQELKMQRETFQQAGNGSIFKQFYTKIGPISFGNGIIRYFAKNVQLASKLHLQLIIIQALDQSLIDKIQFRDFQLNIWGDGCSLITPIKEQWLKWKAINKESLVDNQQEELYDEYSS